MQKKNSGFWAFTTWQHCLLREHKDLVKAQKAAAIATANEMQIFQEWNTGVINYSEIQKQRHLQETYKVKEVAKRVVVSNLEEQVKELKHEVKVWTRQKQVKHYRQVYNVLTLLNRTMLMHMQHTYSS